MAKSTFKGGDKLKKALAELERKVAKGGTVEAGVFEDAEYPDHTKVAQVAQWMEFGTKTSDPRPFMRQTINDHQNEWGTELEGALKKTDYDVAQALGMVGETIASQISDTIEEGNFEPNSELTNLLKDRYPRGDYGTKEFLKAISDLENGASAPARSPLKWSRRLINSIRSQVSND